MKYTIYQLDVNNPDVLKERKLFESWEMLNKFSTFDFGQYKKVYEDDVQEDKDIYTTLDNIFRTFNIDHPADFKGHSLSVSDIVTLDGVKYYCDNYDWVKIK